MAPRHSVYLDETARFEPDLATFNDGSLAMKTLARAALAAAVLLLAACGGGSSGNGGDDGGPVTPPNHWDQMSWDQGRWN
jgi:hypothetical protein